uniref:RIIa domain-containing protein n=1 Tax=Calidris pygmaea TaxID=425635 RepID=A0A8C3K200_9CHAR
MATPSSNVTLRLPDGFQTLLEGLALAVLRAQPADVVAFAAQHFQKLASGLPRVPITHGIRPALCAHQPGCQACSVC